MKRKSKNDGADTTQKDKMAEGSRNGYATPELSGAATPSDSNIVETDLLVVGAGPAGAGLACFLASHGTFYF